MSALLAFLFVYSEYRLYETKVFIKSLNEEIEKHNEEIRRHNEVYHTQKGLTQEELKEILEAIAKQYEKPSA